MRSIITRVLPVETNIVIADLADQAPDARETARQLREKDVTVTVVGSRRLRTVTHLEGGRDWLLVDPQTEIRIRTDADYQS